MSLTINMTTTQQRHIAFLITDYLSNAFQPILADDLLELSVRTNLEDVMSDDNIAKYVSELASRKAPPRQTKKILTDEEIEEREAAKVAKKADRDRIREEKKAAKKADKEAARAAKKAAAGPGWTTKEMTDSEGNIVKGINGASLRVAKRKDTERGVWPMNQVVMKVNGNWTDENKAEFQRQFGTPFVPTSSTNKTVVVPVGPNMATILKAAVASETKTDTLNALSTIGSVSLASETNTDTPVASETKTVTQKPVDVIASKKVQQEAKRQAKKVALAAKKLKLAEKKREIAAKKAKVQRLAEEKRLADIAAKEAEEKRLAEMNTGGETKNNHPINDGDMMIESAGEEDYDEDELDEPKPWSHHSYEGDQPIFKDADNGVYHYNEEEGDFEIIGFYYEDEEGGIAADTLQLD